ncbi:MAG: hypothetical protein ACTSRZ_06545 [Promethearchaeota archaeon]
MKIAEFILFKMSYQLKYWTISAKNYATLNGVYNNKECIPVATVSVCRLDSCLWRRSIPLAN